MTDDRPIFLPPNNRPVSLWVILAAGTLFVVFLAFIFQNIWMMLIRNTISLDQGIAHAGVGKELPMLELQPLTGTTDSISLKDVGGKIVFIDYWGTWCPPCVMEFPHMVELWDQFRRNPEFVFVSVSSTFAQHENVAEVKEATDSFLKSHSVTFPTYIDADGASRQTLACLIGPDRDLAYPTTVVVDRKGIIRAVWVGYRPGSEKQMEETVSKLLMEKSPSRNDEAK